LVLFVIFFLIVLADFAPLAGPRKRNTSRRRRKKRRMRSRIHEVYAAPALVLIDSFAAFLAPAVPI
jgi:hypothetical protein